MLSAVASAMVFVEKRTLFQVIPNRLVEFLTAWEVRVLIIVSLTLQILLLTLGKRRKYICKIWIRITLWCAYLLADWVSIVSLGIISKNTLDECQKGRDANDPLNQLMWFWAQFFLLHLGGPDTITAYSLEDNELWLRHLVGLMIQTGLAFYILLVAFPSNSLLPYLSILIFIAGLIKYGERLLALRAANSENFRDSMLKEPDPGPNYAKFMEEYTLKKAEGFYVKAAKVIEIPVQDERSSDSGKLIAEAYKFYLTFKCLFADAILSFQDRDTSLHYFKPPLSSKQAFDVVEVELGFMFDELYTKASIVYKKKRFLLRMITFPFTFFSLMAFLFFCDKGSYKTHDLVITYLLLGVAIFLEIYAVSVAINSDWTRNWLSRRKGKHFLSLIIRLFQEPNEKRWSKKMAQRNLLDLCVRDKGRICLTIQKFLLCIRMGNYLDKHLYKHFLDVSEELQELIFRELRSYTGIDNAGPTSLWNRRGSFTLKKYKFHSTTEEGEYDQRILLWHIATDICCSLENVNSSKRISEKSKQISNYMLYLLIECPFMLPIGIGMIRFRDTCAEVKEFLEERNVKNSKVKACKRLLKVNTEVEPGEVKGDRSKSVLFDACKLAKSLMERKEEKWEIISKVWVELLAYAATHCRGNHHARQLRKGGELITHVWLLMAHLGITEQFQINQGHARAKLVVK